MEGEKILMAAGVTVAAVVGAFVFWGPPGTSRIRQRRGQIAGLHNFGRTCFLNTLLQALAACPQFTAWLQLHNGPTANKNGLVSSVLNTLEVINGTHSSLRGDPYSPGAVIRALTAIGWVIPHEEHDAHELFHLLLDSLEEEAARPKKNGSITDALPDSKTGLILANRPSSAMLSDFANADYNESTNMMRLVRSEAHTPDSPVSVHDHDVLNENSAAMGFGEIGDIVAGNMHDSSPENNSPRTKIRSMHPQTHGDGKQSPFSYRSLERLNRGPGRVSVWCDKYPSQVPHPFQGAMGSQIICSGCGFKSSVRYDKFASVTLNLPMQFRSGLSLGQLLSEHITSEEILDVKCESCNETTIHNKSTTFAKLPACLCIHLSRTIWLPTGKACKRQDYVHFPESLSMAPYSFVQPHLNSQTGTPWGSTMSLFSGSLPTNTAEMFGYKAFTAMFPKNLYRLLAVVVHSGEAQSGHFVTYRRGALRNAHRWFYTSDTVVREVLIDEVLSAPAYLLFYDRGPQRQMQ